MKYRLLGGVAALAVIAPIFHQWSNEPSWRVTRMIDEGERHEVVRFTIWSWRRYGWEVECRHRDTAVELGCIFSQPKAVSPRGMPLVDGSILRIEFEDGRSARFWIYMEDEGLWIADPNSGMSETQYPTHYKSYSELSPVLREIGELMEQRGNESKHRLVIAENGSRTTTIVN